MVRKKGWHDDRVYEDGAETQFMFRNRPGDGRIKMGESGKGLAAMAEPKIMIGGKLFLSGPKCED